MNFPEINILYQDDDLLAVEKPAGLLTVPGRGPDKQDCLINRLLPRYPNSRIVHRLDMATSGIVLIPQNHYSHSQLSQQFQQRTVKKEYQAIVEGTVAGDNGCIDLPLICDWPNRPKQKVCYEQGKPAKTEFRVIDRNSNTSPRTRVALTPITGRSHQLRVHMMALGHPILGDYFYGTPQGQKASNRLLLHACHIEVVQPKTHKTISVTSAVPF